MVRCQDGRRVRRADRVEPVHRADPHDRPRPTTRSATPSRRPRCRRCSPALAYVTGDLSLLRDDLRPDPLLIVLPQGGLHRSSRRRHARLALDALVALPRRRLRPAPRHLRRRPAADHGVRRRRPRHGRLPPAARGGARLARRGPARTGLAPSTTSRPSSTSASSSSARGCRACSPRTGCSRPASRSSCSRRTTTSAAPGSRTRYPGCRVDNPNHNYSYSFAQRHDWPFHFSTQDVLLDYFRRCADDVRPARPHPVRHRGASATWSDDDRPVDGARSRTRDGARRPDRGRTRSISAVGQLNRPSYPDIDGRDSFAGPSFHSARWDHDVDLRGKRVAVIGTGASAVQFIPEIARVVGELARVPAHAAVDRPDARVPRRGPARACAGSTRTCRRTASGTASGSSGRWATASLAGVRVDPDWEPSDGARSAR